MFVTQFIPHKHLIENYRFIFTLIYFVKKATIITKKSLKNTENCKKKLQFKTIEIIAKEENIQIV